MLRRWGVYLGIGWVSVCGWGMSWGGAIAAQQPAIMSTSRNHQPETTRARNLCPEPLDELMPLMLRDLPAYTNRVIQRSRVRNRTEVAFNYILIAGNPEYEPLSLGPGQYHSTSREGDPKQVFFTTLERQYSGNSVVQMQNYHWLFLTQTQNGWQLALMLSRFGGYELIDQPPSPPEDSSEGAIAQAIRLWLRDCQAGEIRPLASPAVTPNT